MAKKAWRFHCFLSERGEDVIDTWHNGVSKKGRAKLERTLEHLAVQEKTEWSRPQASPLGDHIYVIRFTDENRMQHRVAGHFHADSLAFVLTQPGYEKDDIYHPENFTKLAKSHKSTCDGEFNSRTCSCFVLDVHRAEDLASADTVHGFGARKLGRP
jgi:hypothetical protein